MRNLIFGEENVKWFVEVKREKAPFNLTASIQKCFYIYLAEGIVQLQLQMCKRTSMCKENIVQIYIAGSAHQRILCALRAALESSGVVASDLEFAARKLFSAQASHTTRKCFDAPPIEFASKMWKLLSSFFVEGQNLEIVLETMGNCWRRQSKFFKEGEKYIKVFLSRQIHLIFFEKNMFVFFENHSTI